MRRHSPLGQYNNKCLKSGIKKEPEILLLGAIIDQAIKDARAPITKNKKKNFIIRDARDFLNSDRLLEFLSDFGMDAKIADAIRLKI